MRYGASILGLCCPVAGSKGAKTTLVGVSYRAGLNNSIVDIMDHTLQCMHTRNH